MKIRDNRRAFGQLRRTDPSELESNAIWEQDYADDAPVMEPRDYDRVAGYAVEPIVEAGPEDFTSVLGGGSSWNGNLNSEGSVRLDGEVSGEINAAGTVLISQGARVNAKIEAKFVIVAGSFDGQIFCAERLELQTSSRIKGSIKTKRLSVGDGAFIDGEIHMVDEGAALPASASKSSSSYGRKADAQNPVGDEKDKGGKRNGHALDPSPVVADLESQ